MKRRFSQQDKKNVEKTFKKKILFKQPKNSNNVRSSKFFMQKRLLQDVVCNVKSRLRM